MDLMFLIWPFPPVFGGFREILGLVLDILFIPLAF
uniref:Uncharacterized protein n=1 Tax=Rhizophora mucronata TaxID=61149 RepID=A0A2P2PGD7_RHIMU